MEKPTFPFLKHPVLFLIVSLLLLAAHEIFAEGVFPVSDDSDGNGMTVLQHNQNVFNVGVVIDMGSWIGESVHSCVEMAISDFYASKQNRLKIRLVLHARDSRGDPLHAISSARDLLENAKVQSLIIGPETIPETIYLGGLGSKAKVPVFTFSPILSSPGDKFPFLVQINQDETLQFKAIANILSWHQWKSVSLIFEDTDNGRNSIPYLVGSLQERSIRVSHRTFISPFSTYDQILDELHKLAFQKQTNFIVHLSPSITYRLFSMAKRLGMMREGYAWIVTDKAMNHIRSANQEDLETMQGVVGLRAYIPSSSKLQDFNFRWKKEFYRKNSNPFVESGEIDVLGIWAYDTIWALAESIQTLRHGEQLLDGISGKRISGLSGEFQILDGRLHSEAFEIVNVIGKGERRVGMWTLKHDKVVKGRSPSSTSSSEIVGLDEAIMWPGFTKASPRGLLMANGQNLRIAVLNNAGFPQFVSVNRDNLTNTTRITGFCVDVFYAVINSLSYQVGFDLIPWVYRNGSNLGSYTDLINKLYDENFDGIIGDVTITYNRSLNVDFTVTYTDIGLGMITKRENGDDIWLFWKPLQLDLWVATIVAFIVVGFSVGYFERPTNPEFKEGSVANQAGKMLYFGFSTLFYAQREKLTSNLSRLVVIVWLFTVLILVATYTATLTSMVTLQKIQQGPAGEYYVGTHLNSFLGSDRVVNNTNFVDDRLQYYSSPDEYVDALSKGFKKGGVVAIIDEIPYLKVFLAKYGDEYAMVSTRSTTNGFGFAFGKTHGQLVSDMSQAIMKLREEGRLAMMENTWFNSGSPSSSFMDEAGKHAASKPNILSLRSFGGLFFMSFSSIVIGILIRLGSYVLKNLPKFFSVLKKIIKAVQHRVLLAMEHMRNRIATTAAILSQSPVSPANE
ncbi:OLC1v1013431C1 [Oldenlandia corymbosa var. corymbosa]|uniref:Glutamate receptor n=1 Tax=Oldenlandia corymbosa var. corymbosa TaxID=529605 RepID=A0AAV1E0C7_OLDCO|nr:OLC1v1013431C1 [Oldenlandia corymbosa var. corymbosa]